MQPATLAAGKWPDELLWIGTIEIEAAQIGTRRHFKAADGENVLSAGNRFPRRLVVGQRLARLVDDGQLHSRTDTDLACVGLFFSRQHLYERRLASTVVANVSDDR